MKDLFFILFLSISWLLIFYFLKYLRIIIAYLLIGFPYFFELQLWHKKKDSSQMIEKIIESIFSENCLEIANLESINKKIDLIEKNSEKIYHKKKANFIWNLMFSNGFIKSFINSQIAKPYQSLDLKRNLLNLNSTDPSELLSATMNIKYDDSLTVSEKVKIMEAINSNYSANKELMEIVNYD